MAYNVTHLTSVHEKSNVKNDRWHFVIKTPKIMSAPLGRDVFIEFDVGGHKWDVKGCQNFLPQRQKMLGFASLTSRDVEFLFL